MFLLADVDPTAGGYVVAGAGFFYLAFLKNLRDQTNFNRIVQELREEAQRWRTVAIEAQKRADTLQEQLWEERNARIDPKSDNS